MEDEEEISLEDLTRTYQRLLGAGDSDVRGSTPTLQDAQQVAPTEDSSTDSSGMVVTPAAIIESVLFVGHPKNRPVTGQELAALMRNVDVAAVEDAVAALNTEYEDSESALRIFSDKGGYRMGLAQQLGAVRESFLSRPRPVKLNQQAIDCLSLVAYHPGATLGKIEDLLNRPAAATLRLLLRRNLIEMRREGEGKSAVQRYFPAEKFFELTGTESLDDLPRIE